MQIKMSAKKVIIPGDMLLKNTSFDNLMLILQITLPFANLCLKLKMYIFFSQSYNNINTNNYFL